MRRLEAHEPCVEGLGHGPGWMLGTEVGMLHHKAAWLLVDRKVAVVGAADGDAIVARGRLDPHIVEAGLAQDATIGDAVEADTAGHAEVLGAGFLPQPDGAIEQHGFGVVLHAPSQVLPMRHERALLPIAVYLGKPWLVEVSGPLRHL